MPPRPHKAAPKSKSAASPDETAGSPVILKGEKLAIKYRKVAALVPYAKNARTHSAAQIEQIIASIKEFGWTNPVLVDEKGGIIAGHGRVLEAQIDKMEWVPTVEIHGFISAIW